MITKNKRRQDSDTTLEVGRQILEVYAESRLRPFRRRSERTRRPPTVAILLRKPCRRLRTSLEGW